MDRTTGAILDYCDCYSIDPAKDDNRCTIQLPCAKAERCVARPPGGQQGSFAWLAVVEFNAVRSGM